MSLSNILKRNDYNIFVNSITVGSGAGTGSGNTSSLDYYSSEDLNLVMTYEDGTNATYDCKIERIGNVVHFYVPYNVHNNSSIVTPNRFFVGGEIPTAYRPITGSTSGSDTVKYGPAYCLVNTTRSFGVFDIKNNGAFDLYSSPTLASPSPGVDIAFYPQVYTWYIA